MAPGVDAKSPRTGRGQIVQGEHHGNALGGRQPDQAPAEAKPVVDVKHIRSEAAQQPLQGRLGMRRIRLVPVIDVDADTVQPVQGKSAVTGQIDPRRFTGQARPGEQANVMAGRVLRQGQRFHVAFGAAEELRKKNRAPRAQCAWIVSSHGFLDDRLRPVGHGPCTMVRHGVTWCDKIQSGSRFAPGPQRDLVSGCARSCQPRPTRVPCGFSPPRSRALYRFIRSPLFLAAHLVALGVAITLYFPRAMGMDDAFITFRYAANLAAGHGLVHNPGEAFLGTSAPLYALVLGLMRATTDLDVPSGRCPGARGRVDGPHGPGVVGTQGSTPGSARRASFPTGCCCTRWSSRPRAWKRCSFSRSGSWPWRSVCGDG